MKKFVKIAAILAALIIGLSCFMGCATKIKPGTPITIPPKVEVFEFPNLKAAELYDKANAWVVRMFTHLEAVIEFSNKDTGSISGKYVYNALKNVIADYGMGNVIRWTLVKMFVFIECKDGKLRLTLQPVEIRYEWPNQYAGIQYRWEGITTASEPYVNFENEAASLKESLKEFILQNTGAW